MGRNEDDYRDETNVGYTGGNKKRQNFKNHFGEPKQLTIKRFLYKL